MATALTDEAGDLSYTALIAQAQGMTQTLADSGVTIGTVVAVSFPSRRDQIVSLLAASNRPVLSIADVPGFALKSGMVNLVKVDEKMRFEINQKEVEARGLTMSARLLQLALIVRTRTE